MDYTGYKVLSSVLEIADFYQHNFPIEELKENEYVIVKDDSQGFDYFRKTDEKLERVNYPSFKSEQEGVIKPLNPEQYCAMDMLFQPNSKIKVLKGVYGSGKDYLMWHTARYLLDKGKFNKIVYVRPHITVAGLPDIGALPGDASEKLEWTLAPLYDTAGRDEVLRMVQENQLEAVPMNFIRGRSFENSIVYVTEGQNMTTEMVKLLIGRIGEGSELWINGDTHQVDKKIFAEDNGIIKMVDKLSGNPLFSYVYLPTTERSAVARLADLLDD